MLTHERLLDALHYDMCTGAFVWRNCRIPSFNGRPAGSQSADGYFYIKIDGNSYKKHRLAWFYHHGEWPEDCIDHIDGNTANNSIANLRECSHAQNMKNAKLRVDNQLSCKGVDFHNGKYRARISSDGVPVYLGHFHSIEDARTAYADAAIRLHGSFARLQ